MLKELSIKDYGLIDSLTLTFAEGLNVFTGETGAGKSIIIGALRMALGSRMSATNIREGSDSCTVEAVYILSRSPLKDDPRIKEFLDEDATIIIRRTVGTDQKNKIKVNGRSLTVNELKTIGDALTDLHGPHDHQMLLDESKHIAFLDDLTAFNGIDGDFSRAYASYRSLVSALHTLRADNRDREQELDVLAFKIKELSQVPLDAVEHDALFAEQKRIQNTETLHRLTATLSSLIEDDEHSLSRLLREVSAAAVSVARIDDSAEYIAEETTDIQERINDLASKISSYRDALSYDDERATHVNDVCDRYNALKRKYAPTIEELIAYADDAQKRHKLLSDYEHNSTQLEKDTLAAKTICETIAKKMRAARCKAAEKMQRDIVSELKDLGIKSVAFRVSIEDADLNERGSDLVRFYISTNAGETLKPLSEIVSSGEAARVMLALKKTLAATDPVPTLVFDEIDAQIGGRLGTVIGKKLTELSLNRQVILITHLPQIAAFGNAHYRIVKQTARDRTVTTAALIEGDDRLTELAHMLSGKENDKTALTHAREMLASAQST
jgi:DNA repair protein RecN (Recombination protein N)